MNNPFEEIFKRLENIEKMISPVGSSSSEEPDTAQRTGRQRTRFSQNIRSQQHNRIFGQLPLPFSQHRDDTLCEAWSHPTFRCGRAETVDAAAICPGFQQTSR